MTRWFPVAVVLTCATLCAAALYAGEDPKPEEKPLLDPKVNGGVLPTELKKLPVLLVPKLKDIEKLSGDLKADSWKDAAKVELKDVVTSEKARFKTEVYVFCSDTALYVGYKCFETKMDNLSKEGEIWSHDEIEFFFEPFKDTIKRPYHQIIVDFQGDVWQGRTHKYPKHNYQGLDEAWDGAPEKAVGKGEGFWTVELKIPFASMKLTDEAKGKKTLWRANFCRNRPGKGDEEETSSWAPLGSQAFHTPSKFGYLLPETFSSKELTDDVVKQATEAAKGTEKKEIDAATLAEMDKKIGELNSDQFDERSKAIERLKELAKGPALVSETLKKKLLDAFEQNKEKEIELVNSIKEVLTEIEKAQGGMDDEDPLPDNLKNAEFQ